MVPTASRRAVAAAGLQLALRCEGLALAKEETGVLTGHTQTMVVTECQASCSAG